MRRMIMLSVNNSWNILNFRVHLIRRLQEAGFEIGVISPPDAHALALEELGIRHFPAPIDSKGIRPTADLRLLLRYLRLLYRNRPVAYLAWTIKPNIYGSIAAHILGIPVINNVSGLGTVFIRKGPLTTLVSLLYRLAFSRSDKVFFQNPDDSNMFVSKGLVSRVRTALLPGSGINTTYFAPCSTNPRMQDPDASIVFLMVARLLRDKGVVEYVEAARILRAKGIAARFQILGFLDADNRTAITREELDAWLGEGIISYLGAADDVRPHIAAADCIVLPSYREGMPRALLEGAALAKPLIASRVAGCTEIARDGINALLCEARDAASLADAMIRMANLSDAQRNDMGQAGRRIAMSEFDERLVSDRYIDALTKALTPRAAI